MKSRTALEEGRDTHSYGTMSAQRPDSFALTSMRKKKYCQALARPDIATPVRLHKTLEACWRQPGGRSWFLTKGGLPMQTSASTISSENAHPLMRDARSVRRASAHMAVS